MVVTQAHLDAIPGWFAPVDVALFRFFLERQDELGIVGDLAEVGVYQGKSAVLIGSHTREEEQFTVVDLFEDHDATDGENSRENNNEYLGLQRIAFEVNYRRVLGTLPHVVQGLSSTVVNVARHGTHRFVHIDASHLYEHVRDDIGAARTLARDDAIVVLDDFRSAHTPGVAAAAWEAIATDGLVPLVVSPVKMYATWGDPERWRTQLDSWLATSGLSFEEQHVLGHPLRRVWQRAPRAARWVPPAAVRPLLRVRSRLLAGSGAVRSMVGRTSPAIAGTGRTAQ